MDARAAKGIAANIRVIVENTALLAMIDAGGYVTQAVTVDRVQCTIAMEKAEGAIAQWLMQPMTLR